VVDRGRVENPTAEWISRQITEATTSFYGGPRGNVGQGFREADVIVEGEFRTQVQTHCCLEPHAVVADWRADGLTLYISTQDTAGVRRDVAAAFGLPREKVRVITEFMGGGFGSKLGAGDYVYFAVELSRKAGAPVSLILDREEEQLASGSRPGTWQRLRIGARRDGSLTAFSLLSYGTAGIAAGAGVGNIAQAMYDCPNFEMAQYDVFVNAGPGCAMRAPGNVQGAFALEQSIDELAERLRVDPIALRDRIDQSAARREERRIGAASFGWSQRRLPGVDAGPVKRGIGMAQSFWPGIVQTSASCEVRLQRDGLVEIRSSVQDIGTGIRTVLAQVVAEELGLRPEDVSVRIGDTDFPLGPSSGGSKTTGSITPAARKAAYQVRQALFAAVAPELGAPPEELVVGQGRIFLRANPAHGIGFRQAASRLNKDFISAVADRGDNYGGFRVTGAHPCFPGQRALSSRQARAGMGSPAGTTHQAALHPNLLPAFEPDRAVMGPHAQTRHAQQVLRNLRPIRRCDARFFARKSSPELGRPM
jgi:xanthine dehydrogenase YagR molybdenum-binding subunit